MGWFGVNKKGNSLLEVIVAVAIFGLMATTMISLVVGSFIATRQGGEQTEAEAFAQEGVEAVRSIRDGAWNELVYSPAVVATSSNQWVLNSGASQLLNNKYARTITLDSVCRDGFQAITNCPGTYTDVHTKKVTVSVIWKIQTGATNSVQRVLYLTNWDGINWVQTDWSGGSGQSIWSAITKYDSDDNNMDRTIVGQLSLLPLGTGTWSDKSMGVTQNIMGISIVSSTNIWAVGQSGKFFRYNGTSWSEFVDIGSQDIKSVKMISSTVGWAGGTSGKIFRYTGSAWSEFVDTGNESWNSIAFVSSTDGWIVANGGNIRRYNGSSWSVVTSPVSNNLNSIFMVDSDDGWAVGASGKILRWNGTTWSEFVDTGSQTWASVFLISPTDGWVVGNSGSIWRWNGTSWSLFVDTGSQTWAGVYFTSASNGWVVGNGGSIYRWNGSSWASASSPTSQNLLGIVMVNTVSGWATGDKGTILNFVGGNAYVTSSTLTSSAFSMSNVSPVQAIEWDQTVPACSPACQIKFQVRTAPNSGGSPGTWSSWYGVSGVGSYFVTSTGSLLPVATNGNQWVQYKVELIGDGTHTPTLQEVRVNYK